MKNTKLLLPFAMLVSASLPLTVLADGHGNHHVDNAHRSEANQQRDAFRKPYQTLEFFGVKPDSKVVEILPGGGWYTEILAPMLKEQGTLVAAHYPANVESEYRKRSRTNFEKKLADNKNVYGKVVVADFDTNAGVDKATMDADVVLTFRGLHGLQNGNELAAAFSQFNQMLKVGGKLGVVQHQAPEGFDPIETAKKGYLPKSYVVAVAVAAGFELEAEAYFHNNHQDRIIVDGVEGGVWSLPPSLNVKEDADKEKFKKVGESNRMTLLFSKR
ncbi:class I SAM-dependent methyltransferase [Pseudoalteromonas tunicata]|uniref:class I SAM-dependent methyltransferase n=1 Tax=Pseudoalteromonas tunicata TaxID=314281 RepID=UPI00273FCAFB|nr:methyltransferase [Pseudoalteromonas tunicata]MDP4984435.1 methyltransferase [Pseudoalteromonas tunicata]MDP5212851.1 methyltransferase [Pseudoalteromonas tunicata]